ncbi:nucleus protein [Echinococcus multilocularis]|uniref:Protein bl n=1 Tax=Echinococcus multilocularis TaxID=6211 RepID=A0A0S4MLU9_ECHMU|nr:nucleus protein [Echinococcus multilocularis]
MPSIGSSSIKRDATEMRLPLTRKSVTNSLNLIIHPSIYLSIHQIIRLFVGLFTHVRPLNSWRCLKANKYGCGTKRGMELPEDEMHETCGAFYTSQHSTSTAAAAEMQTSLPTPSVSPWAHETAVADCVARYEQLAPAQAAL